MSVEEEPSVWVRRQWNDWRKARVRVRDLQGLHMTDTSGGINVRAPRDFLHGYIWCNQLLEGELAHSCSHGAGPHRIKVCVIKKDNIPSTLRLLQPRPTIAAEFATGLAQGEREGPF